MNTKHDSHQNISDLKAELESKPSHGRILFLFLSIVVLLWLSVPVIVSWFHGAKDASPTPGTVGDSYGTVNALFAGLAFAGLIWTIIQTNREIRLQQRVAILQIEEHLESRKLMDDQASAQSEMNQAINKLCDQTKNATLVQTYSALLEFMPDTFAFQKIGQPKVDRNAIQHELFHLIDQLKSKVDEDKPEA